MTRVGGNVNTSDGDFVGRDKYTYGGLSVRDGDVTPEERFDKLFDMVYQIRERVSVLMVVVALVSLIVVALAMKVFFGG